MEVWLTVRGIHLILFFISVSGYNIIKVQPSESSTPLLAVAQEINDICDISS